jgi:predicted esterase
LVEPPAAERSHGELAAAGVAVTTQTFGSGHAIDRTQIAAISTWLKNRFDLSTVSPLG